MAYRKMAGPSGLETQAPSFLDEFLEQIQPLPTQVRAKFAEMRELDDRASTLMSDAERAAAEAMRLGPTRNTGGNDPLKKAFQDVLGSQAKAADATMRKVEIAEGAYGLIEETIKSLDEKLREYEVQLKKEGRWPTDDRKSTIDKAATGRKAGGAASPAVPSAPAPATPKLGAVTAAAGASTVTGAAAAATASAPITAVPSSRNKKRDREKAEKLAKAAIKAKPEEKVPAAPAAASSSAASAVKQGAEVGAALQGLVVIEDAEIDPNEERYCYCNQISFGDMVACESGTKCLYEWFHYSCVGLTEEPPGVWYCPECAAKKKKKRKGTGASR